MSRELRLRGETETSPLMNSLRSQTQVAVLDYFLGLPGDMLFMLTDVDGKTVLHYAFNQES